MRLYLIRHPRPDVTSGICYGSTDVLVKSQDTMQVLEALRPLLPLSAPVFSSPLRRCAELAKKLASLLNATRLSFDPRLAEMNFGAWEMRSWEEIPREEVDAWAQDLCAWRPGGGENVLQVARRLQAFLDDLRRSTEGNVIVVAHAGTIRLLLEYGSGATPEEATLAAASIRREIGYGQLIVLDC